VVAGCFCLASAGQRLGARRDTPQVPWSLVRVDPDNGQVYAVVDSSILKSILVHEDSLKILVSRISNEALIGKWPRATLQLHVFSQARHALPKKEVHARDSQAWKADYLARYDAWKKELVIHPEIPGKRKQLLFDMCPEPEVSNFHYIHCGQKKPWEN
jgi:hypothetical protein